LNRVAESDEDNNRRRIDVRISATPLPNVRIGSIQWAPDPGSNRRMNIQIIIDDVAVSGPEFDVTLNYANGTTAVERLVWTGSLSGGSSINTRSMPINGLQTVRVVADPRNQIAEFDETDNDRVFPAPPVR